MLDALTLGRSKREYDLWAYVIMPEHVHVVILPQANVKISAILTTLKQSVSKPRCYGYAEMHPNSFRVWRTGSRTGCGPIVSGSAAADTTGTCGRLPTSMRRSSTYTTIPSAATWPPRRKSGLGRVVGRGRLEAVSRSPSIGSRCRHCCRPIKGGDLNMPTQAWDMAPDTQFAKVFANSWLSKFGVAPASTMPPLKVDKPSASAAVPSSSMQR